MIGQSSKPAAWRQQGIVIILSILALLTATSCALHEGDIFILPGGYRGTVIVAFDQADGLPEVRQASKRVFKIPATGVLRTKDRGITDALGSDEFYFDMPTGRRSIRYEHNLPAKDKKEVVVGGFSTGKVFLNGNSIEYVQFFVGNSDEIQLASDSMDHSLGLINILDPADPK